MCAPLASAWQRYRSIGNRRGVYTVEVLEAVDGDTGRAGAKLQQSRLSLSVQTPHVLRRIASNAKMHV